MPRSRAHWLAGRRVLKFAAVILVAVSLLAIGLRLYMAEAESKVAAGTLVYLTPVKNMTNEHSFDNLTELLQAGLTQSAHINLLDQSRVGDTLQLMTKPPDTVIDQPTAREIALRIGAQRVIFYKVTGGSGHYQLEVEIQRPDPSGIFRYYEHWPKTFTWQTTGSTANATTIRPELLTQVREATNWLRGKAGESKNDIARLDAPPESVTTIDWDALEYYSHARALLSQNRTSSAVLELKNAISKDPQFALAYASLGDVLLSLHSELEGYRAYDKALGLSLQNRLTRKEEERIRGMRAVDTADYEIAVEAFRDYAINYKEDVNGWTYPTFPLRMLGRDEEAIANLRYAVTLSPAQAFAEIKLAEELILTGKQGEARYWIAKLKEQGHLQLAQEIEVELLFVNHQYEQAAKILEQFHSSANPIKRSYSYGEQASLAAETGHYEEAIKFLYEGKTEDDGQDNTELRAMHSIDRAYLECKLQETDQCIKDAYTGFLINPTPRNALRADTVYGYAFSHSPHRFAPQIVKQLAQIEHLLPTEDYGKLTTFVTLRTHGELQFASGNSKAALQTFRNLAAKDAPAENREYLARAIVAYANTREGRPEAADLLKQAVDAYKPIVKQPGLVWFATMDFVPGFYADQVDAYLELADRLRVEDSTVREARSTFSYLRGQMSITPQRSVQASKTRQLDDKQLNQ